VNFPAGVSILSFNYSNLLDSRADCSVFFARPAARPRGPYTPATLPSFMRRLACGLVLVLAACTTEAPQVSSRRGPLVSALASVGLQRHWALRLSVPMETSTCFALDSLSTLACDGGAVSKRATEILDIARRAAQVTERNANADGLHAAALIGLASPDPSGKSVERSVSYLEMLTRIAPRNADIYADLAAARMAFSIRRGGARALLGALEASSRALGLDRDNLAALYNRALASDMLGLNADALTRWRAYLARDSTSRFAGEARRRVDLLKRYRSIEMPDTSTPAAAWKDFATRTPAESRVFAWEELLPMWGDAVLTGDSARARLRLDQVRAIATAVATTIHEWSLSDAVVAVDRARDRATLRGLASAHVTYGWSQTYVHRSVYPPADSGFLRILANRNASAPLRALAGYGHANALLYDATPVASLRAADSLFRVLPAKRYAGPVARTYWLRAVALYRSVGGDAGLDAARRARALFDTLGEADNVASAIGLEGEVLLQNGSLAAGFNNLHRSALLLRRYPQSLWRHNALLILARASTRAGLPLATQVIEQEDATVVTGGTRLTSIVESALARSRSAWTAGQTTSADSALAYASQVLARIPPNPGRQQLEHEVGLTIATGLERTRPDSARLLLDSAIAFFGDRDFPMKLIPSLLERSSIAMAKGDTAAMRSDLTRASSTFLGARAAISTAVQSAALLAEASSVFDALIMLNVDAGRPNAALRTFVEGRGAFSRLSARTGEAPTSATQLSFALIGDTLLTWAVTPEDTAFVRQTVDRRAIRIAIERVRSAMELGLSAVAMRPDLEKLYEYLLKPVEARGVLRGDGLAIAAGEELGSVPFAALLEPGRERYLVERYAIRYVPTGAQLATGRAALKRSPRALVVANARPDQDVFADLSPLPSANDEARDVARSYPSSVLLDGSEADSASIVRALPGVELFHFAGHAVFDDVEPDRSYLAIGSRPLTASSIANLPARGIRLVVLSACESMRSAGSSGGGFFGLTEAFLAAGARGVVGSNWRVDDIATRAFMREFHRQYSSTGDGPGALRAAQLSILRDKTTSPSAWAAFMYAGF